MVFFPVCSVSVSKCPSSHKGTSHWIKAHSSSVWPHLNSITSSKTSWQRKVPVVRTQIHIFQGHNSTLLSGYPPRHLSEKDQGDCQWPLNMVPSSSFQLKEELCLKGTVHHLFSNVTRQKYQAMKTLPPPPPLPQTFAQNPKAFCYPQFIALHLSCNASINVGLVIYLFSLLTQATTMLSCDGLLTNSLLLLACSQAPPCTPLSTHQTMLWILISHVTHLPKATSAFPTAPRTKIHLSTFLPSFTHT
jgi:hypothetical protein